MLCSRQGSYWIWEGQNSLQLTGQNCLQLYRSGRQYFGVDIQSQA